MGVTYVIHVHGTLLVLIEVICIFQMHGNLFVFALFLFSLRFYSYVSPISGGYSPLLDFI